MGCVGLRLEGVTVENKTISLTDEIYAELVDGLKTGLDWQLVRLSKKSRKGELASLWHSWGTAVSQN